LELIGGDLMRWTGLQKQELQEFNRQVNGPDMELITIIYHTKRPDVTNSNWGKTEGVPWQYNNVKCLKEIISEVKFGDNATANVQFGKTNFRFPYIDHDSSGNEIIYDFHDKNKRYFTIIDSNGQSYEIDKIVPVGKVGNRYIAWLAVQG
jgi:hypothetical protein